MRLIVVGAGIVGMTTAYQLARDGHAVTVIDAARQPGTGASHANGSQLSYQFVTPLATPGTLAQLPVWLLRRNSPLRLRLRADPAFWRWTLSFLAACRQRISLRTTQELLELGAYSKQMLHDMLQQMPAEFDYLQQGRLVLYRTEQEFSSAAALAAHQQGTGAPQILSRTQCLEREPALAQAAATIAGGILTPGEESGDCHKLALALQRHLGSTAPQVRFLFDTRISGFRTGTRQGHNCVTAMQTNRGDLEADGYILAHGTGIQASARQLGLDPRIYPLKGYSLTYPVPADDLAPRYSISDTSNKIVYARIGDRLRVAGMVDIGDTSDALRPERTLQLQAYVRQMFPRLAAESTPVPWSGQRAARPNGKPLVCRTPYDNLWLNGGHGMLGFTFSAGCARLLADLIQQREPAIPARHFCYLPSA